MLERAAAPGRQGLDSGLDPPEAFTQLIGRVLRRQVDEKAEAGEELGGLGAWLGDHRAQRGQQLALSFSSQPIRRPLGTPAFAAGLDGGNEPAAGEPVDGVVERPPLERQQLVLAPLPEEPLHLVGVHRPLAEEREDGHLPVIAGLSGLLRHSSYEIYHVGYLSQAGSVALRGARAGGRKTMRTSTLARPCPVPAHLVWLAQSVLAIAVGAMGLVAAITPMPALVQQMPWAADLPPAVVRLIGVAGIAAAAALIAPAATGRAKALVPLCAGGLALVMGCALVFHVQRGGFDALPATIGVGLLAAFVAWAHAGALART